MDRSLAFLLTLAMQLREVYSLIDRLIPRSDQPRAQEGLGANPSLDRCRAAAGNARLFTGELAETLRQLGQQSVDTESDSPQASPEARPGEALAFDALHRLKWLLKVQLLLDGSIFPKQGPWSAIKEMAFEGPSLVMVDDPLFVIVKFKPGWRVELRRTRARSIRVPDLVTDETELRDGDFIVFDPGGEPRITIRYVDRSPSERFAEFAPIDGAE